MAPLYTLAFCLYFLRQNNGYKRQSGKNKIWCKAQISVPVDLVNWASGLLKKNEKKNNNAGEMEGIITGPPQLPCMCQCFNNFLQASWPLALVSLCRTKSCPPELVSGLYCALPPCFHGKACQHEHLGREITDSPFLGEFHYSKAFTNCWRTDKKQQNAV